ncbi:MAG: hypothetical protein QW087_07885, partial [Methanomassiliicoccales archaeon]
EIRSALPSIDWYQYGGDVEIRDYDYRAQVKRLPTKAVGASSDVSYNGPVSNVWMVSPGIFRFVIDLRYATDGDPWIAGANYYILRYDMFKTDRETYLLSHVINIDAPKGKLDIILGSSLATSSAWAGKYSYLRFYESDRNWLQPDFVEPVTMSSNTNDNPICKLVATGDLNLDGRNDIVTVVLTKPGGVYEINAYYRLLDGWNKRTIAIWSSEIKKIALGNIDLDNDPDIIVADISGNLAFYRNDGLWTEWQFKDESQNVLREGAVNTPVEITDLKVANTRASGSQADTERGLDVAVGTRNGIIAVYQNLRSDGTVWKRNALTANAQITVRNYPVSDYNTIYGTIVAGDYTKTMEEVAYDYEEIRESLIPFTTRNFILTQGSVTGEYHTATEDEIAQLANVGNVDDANQVYTVNGGKTVHVVKWDPTNLGSYEYVTPASIRFLAYYKASSESGVIRYIYDSTQIDMIPISNTNGEWAQAEYVFPQSSPYYLDPVKLKDLSVLFENIAASTVDFDYWAIEVTWNVAALQHEWKFNVKPTNTANDLTFYLRAQKVDLNAQLLENFRFYYYTATTGPEVKTFFDFQVTESTVPDVPIVATMPKSISGEVYIGVIDTNRNEKDLTSIRVIEMYIGTPMLVSSYAQEIYSIDISNVVGDGLKDFVVLCKRTTGEGSVLIFANVNGDLFSTAPTIITVAPSLNKIILKSVGVGNIIASDGLNDIAVSYYDSNSKISVIMIYYRETSQSNWLALNLATSYQKLDADNFKKEFLKMVAADINGDGRTDLLVSTADGFLFMFSNYSDSLWEDYVMDRVTDGQKGLIQDINIG